MNISTTDVPNFIRKYYILHELLITPNMDDKIFQFPMQRHILQSGTQASSPQSTKTVHLLTHETPDFIIPAQWPANSPDLNSVDYQILWKLQDRVYRSHATSTSWSRAWSKSGNISTRWSLIKRSGNGVHVLESCVRLRAHGGHFEHRL